MQHLDKEIYIAAIQAAAQVASHDKASLEFRVEQFPKAFTKLMEAVQEHKDKWGNSQKEDDQNLN